MIKVRDILGLPVIYDDGKRSPGFLKDIFINFHKKQVTVFIAEKTGLRKNRILFSLEEIRDIGGGAVVVNSINGNNHENYCENCNGSKKYSDIEKKKEEIKIYSKNGDDLGTVKDIFFNLQTGYIEAFELSDGLVQDIIDGRKIIPLIGKYEFGEENIVVGTEAVLEMTSLKSRIKKKLFE